ncbi:hypothetical protein QF035_004619 [Streptomyces umbrinus]|uniref:Uncharacterized protein n=1 Tax=Streptomyces umbrinus TaxID=67370 RepID=A0ABU0SUT2_9ACTN|nr:hypothetical protein [Streptomyces umbrinus]MDQ1027037.1 hypothetical protein [Streptomyces umbrinus]
MNEAMASCVLWQVTADANYASASELFEASTTSSAAAAVAIRSVPGLGRP